METKATFPALKCLSAAYYPMCSLDQCKGMGTLFLSHVHYRSSEEEAGTSSGTTLCIPLALSVPKVHVIIIVCAFRERSTCIWCLKKSLKLWLSLETFIFFCVLGAFFSELGGKKRGGGHVKIDSDFEESGSKTFSKGKCEFPHVPRVLRHALQRKNVRSFFMMWWILWCTWARISACLFFLKLLIHRSNWLIWLGLVREVSSRHIFLPTTWGRLKTMSSLFLTM